MHRYRQRRLLLKKNLVIQNVCCNLHIEMYANIISKTQEKKTNLMHFGHKYIRDCAHHFDFTLNQNRIPNILFILLHFKLFFPPSIRAESRTITKLKTSCFYLYAMYELFYWRLLRMCVCVSN